MSMEWWSAAAASLGLSQSGDKPWPRLTALIRPTTACSSADVPDRRAWSNPLDAAFPGATKTDVASATPESTIATSPLTCRGSVGSPDATRLERGISRPLRACRLLGGLEPSCAALVEPGEEQHLDRPGHGDCCERAQDPRDLRTDQHGD